MDWSKKFYQDILRSSTEIIIPSDDDDAEKGARFSSRTLREKANKAHKSSEESTLSLSLDASVSTSDADEASENEMERPLQCVGEEDSVDSMGLWSMIRDSLLRRQDLLAENEAQKGEAPLEKTEAQGGKLLKSGISEKPVSPSLRRSYSFDAIHSKEGPDDSVSVAAESDTSSSFRIPHLSTKWSASFDSTLGKDVEDEMEAEANSSISSEGCGLRHENTPELVSLPKDPGASMFGETSSEFPRFNGNGDDSDAGNSFSRIGLISNDKGQARRKFHPRTARTIGFLCFVIGVTVVVALAVTLSPNGQDNSARVAASSGTEDNPGLIPSDPEINTTGSTTSTSTTVPQTASTEVPTFSDPSAVLKTIVLEAGITAEEDLDNTETPQSQALTWLIQSYNVSMPEWQLLQRYAMATFFYSTGGPGWRWRDGWMSTEPECSWFFRTPQPCVGRVLVRFSLMFNNLEGSLPSELGLLSGLEVLLVGGSGSGRLTGHLPSELTRCSNLEFLNVQEQAISGNLDDDLVASWPKLARIDLKGNQLNGTLPPSLGELRSIEKIDLSSNSFSGDIPASYGSILANSLQLGKNDLNGYFPDGRLPNLRSLGLEDNQLTGLPETVVAPRLRTFHVHHNSIGGRLPSFWSLPRQSKVQEIMVNNNMFTGPIPSSWEELFLIEAIDVSSNQLTGSVPSGLTSIASLDTFRLQENSFTGISCAGGGGSEWIADCGVSEGSLVIEVDCPCCSQCFDALDSADS